MFGGALRSLLILRIGRIGSECSSLTGCLYDYVSVSSYTIHTSVFCQCYLRKKEEFYYI